MLIEGKSFGCVDFGSVAASAAMGAVGGGLFDKLGKLRKVKSSASSPSTKIEYATKPGSKLTNIKADITKKNFENNLMNNGFSKSVSKDGSVNIYTKGDVKYTTREFSRSTNGPTAEVFKGNVPVSKIRLGG